MGAGSDDRHVEDALGRAFESPPAREAFRAELRARFVAGARLSASGGATADPDSRVRTPSQGGRDGRSPGAPMIEDALKRIPSPRPRAAFRAAVREEFVAHAAAAAPSVDHAPARGPRHPLDAPRTRRAPSGAPLSSGPLSWQVAAGLLAVAAAVVLLLRVPVEPAPGTRRDLAWEIVESGPVLQLDGRRTSTEDRAALRQAFDRARTVSTFAEPVVFQLADRARFGLESRSLIQMPADDGVLDDAGAEEGGGERDLSFELESGSLHVMTRPGEGVVTIVVTTPHSKVRITGSALTIDVLGEGTCICVASGEATVEVLAGDPPIRVEKDSTCFVFADAGKPAALGASSKLVSAEHLAAFRAFHERALAQF